MTTSEIQAEVCQSTIELMPRWLRISNAVRYSGLSRAYIYERLADGRLKSICLKSKKNATRGIRLIDRLAIDALMTELQAQQEA
jgi:hypothetical protein